MELFKHRRLALGCALFLITLFASFYINIYVRIATLALAGVAFCVIFALYIKKKTERVEAVLIHTSAPVLLTCLALAVSLAAFGSDKLEPYYDGKEHSLLCTVTDVDYSDEYVGFYKIKLHRVDEKDVNAKAALTVHGSPLKAGDVIETNGALAPVVDSTIGFSTKNQMKSIGIYTDVECEGYTLVDSNPPIIRKALDRLNKFLDGRLDNSRSNDTYKLLSALILGNKSNLDSSVKRDFRRIGLSHVLALSGMHIAIVVTILGFALDILRVSRRARSILLILSTAVFVGMTGFSSSAIRAGIMVATVYLLQLFGSRLSTVTSLFVSVTAICLFSPHSIFSPSLLLSFFAMLGCLISSKFTYRVGLFQVIRLKPLRFIVFSLISSLFAICFTLPIISIIFGSISLLSPLSNLILAPIVSLLVYIAPIYMLLSSVPYLGAGIDWVCTKITSLVLFLGEWGASFDGIVLPILSKIQIVGVTIVALSLLALLLVKRKHAIATVCCAAFGIVVFAVGSIALSVHRNNNVYVSAYSSGGSDVIAIEDSGSVTVIDVTKLNNSTYATVKGTAEYLGYYEIENYVVTDYSSKTIFAVRNLVNNTVVHNIYIPKPRTKDEGEQIASLDIEALGREMGINVYYIDGVIETESAKITFAKETSVGWSDLRAIAFSIDHEGATVSYLGASSFELCDYSVTDSAMRSDAIIFGSRGPIYKRTYHYSLPCLDACVFFGDSYDFASDALKQETSGKVIAYEGLPIRFKLNK